VALGAVDNREALLTGWKADPRAAGVLFREGLHEGEVAVPFLQGKEDRGGHRDVTGIGLRWLPLPGLRPSAPQGRSGETPSWPWMLPSNLHSPPRPSVVLEVFSIFPRQSSDLTEVVCVCALRLTHLLPPELGALEVRMRLDSLHAPC
jgi:hypothetical protein